MIREDRCMATIVEVRGDLFKSPVIGQEHTMIAHCVSADYALGAGFALEIENRYHVKETLKSIGTYNYPDCLAVGNVLNLVTKGAYWTKPTYETFRKSLEMAKNYCLKNEVTVIIMPQIGCGLDKLTWRDCKQIIEKVLVENGIDCIVYHYKVRGSKRLW